MKFLEISISISIRLNYSPTTKAIWGCCCGAFIVESAHAPPKAEMKYLGAFFQLAQIDDVPVYDVNVWASESNLIYVQELLRVAAYIFELPRDRLAAEAQSFYDAIQLQMDDRRPVDIYPVPAVDTAEIDWERAKRIEFDNTVLEEASTPPVTLVEILGSFCV